MTARSIFLDSLADAVLAVRSLIKEATANFWTDVQLQNFIKEGSVDVCAKTMCYETITAQTIQDSVIEYSQPSKCIKVRACQFYDSQTSPVSYRGMQKIHPKQIDHLSQTTAGDPYYWYHFGDKVGVLPVPDNINASDIVYIYHSAVTETITNLPAKYREFAVSYAAAMALLKIRKNQAAMSIYNSYLNGVKFARLDLARMEIDSKDMFQTPDKTIGGA